MSFFFKPTAWQHSIEEVEMRAIIGWPLHRYSIKGLASDNFMFVGNIGNEPYIEVGARDVLGTWVVYHAMMLTDRVARELYVITFGSTDLRDCVPSQRPDIGPQYK